MKLKLKKSTALFVILIGCLFSFYNAYSGWVCVVSSDESNNGGACRSAGTGGDLCYPSGSGPSCSYAVLIEQPLSD
jgi:hypothetical protein